MNNDSSQTKHAKNIGEWLEMIFPHANSERVFDDEKASPEVIAAKWAERAIDMLPNKPMKPTR
jgi:hypothetical protein